ncbi:MAG TPA: hypothetical protein VNA25_10020 [Phycisphaerae bacterium]|nr:hypothetical protein [Phycisphaerae bacterium]
MTLTPRSVTAARRSACRHGRDFAYGHPDGGRIGAELGEIGAGLKKGRESSEQVTVFKSVGVAVQDMAAPAGCWPPRHV